MTVPAVRVEIIRTTQGETTMSRIQRLHLSFVVAAGLATAAILNATGDPNDGASLAGAAP